MEAGDPSALLDGALALATDDDERTRLGVAARRYALDELAAGPALRRYDDFVERLLTASE